MSQDLEARAEKRFGGEWTGEYGANGTRVVAFEKYPPENWRENAEHYKAGILEERKLGEERERVLRERIKDLENEIAKK